MNGARRPRRPLPPPLSSKTPPPPPEIFSTTPGIFSKTPTAPQEKGGAGAGARGRGWGGGGEAPFTAKTSPFFGENAFQPGQPGQTRQPGCCLAARQAGPAGPGRQRAASIAASPFWPKFSLNPFETNVFTEIGGRDEAPQFCGQEETKMGEIARSKSRIASDLKTRDSNHWRPCDLTLRLETRDWRFVLNILIQQNCEKSCDLSPRSKIASDWRLAILPI